MISCYNCNKEFSEEEMIPVKMNTYEGEKEVLICKICKIKADATIIYAKLQNDIIFPDALFDFNLQKANSIVIRWNEELQHYKVVISYDMYFFVITFNNKLEPETIQHVQFDIPLRVIEK
jgi:uncharacterized CHY-type Zn-finger protein